MLADERKKLGLKNISRQNKRISIQEETDGLPRYEISKLEVIAQID